MGIQIGGSPELHCRRKVLRSWGTRFRDSAAELHRRDRTAVTQPEELTGGGESFQQRWTSLDNAGPCTKIKGYPSAGDLVAAHQRGAAEEGS